jgi:hypothetical protein
MTEIKRVYLEEYVAAHNQELEKHPSYRLDMKFTGADTHGNLSFGTKDNVISSEDLQVLREICKQVEQTHKLIIP